MANFDKDNKLIWTEITQEEAILYISFLKLEHFRHEREEEVCYLRMERLDSFSRELWWSAHKRHSQDIREINELISKVKEYFRL